MLYVFYVKPCKLCRGSKGHSQKEFILSTFAVCRFSNSFFPFVLFNFIYVERRKGSILLEAFTFYCYDSTELISCSSHKKVHAQGGVNIKRTFQAQCCLPMMMTICSRNKKLCHYFHLW